MKPLLCIDLETTGSGRHKDMNRIVAIGACLVTPEYMMQKLARYHSREANAMALGHPFQSSQANGVANGTIPESQSSQMGMGPSGQAIKRLVLSPKDLPSAHKFVIYIHDDEALEQVEDIENPGPIWAEDPQSLFWFKKTPEGRLMLQKTLAQMRSSTFGPKEALQQFEAFLMAVLNAYPQVILASDGSNFDFSWLDHYRLKYLGLSSINIIKGANHFEPPLDLGSYFAGLCMSPLYKFPLYRPFEYLCRKYALPMPHIKVAHTHNPLDDSMLLALQAMYLLVQFHDYAYQTTGNQMLIEHGSEHGQNEVQQQQGQISQASHTTQEVQNDMVQNDLSCSMPCSMPGAHSYANYANYANQAAYHFAQQWHGMPNGSPSGMTTGMTTVHTGHTGHDPGGNRQSSSQLGEPSQPSQAQV